MTEPLIRVRSLVKFYRMGDSEVHAIDNVSLDIEAGDYVAVTGASGSGKSTFMNMLGALDVPTSGSLMIGGRELGSLSSDELAVFRNQTIGFVFQQFNLLKRTSALDNVCLPLLYSHVSHAERLKRARRCLAQVQLEARAGHFPSQLSGGQQQRVAIARALVNNPRILLADEPTGALDSHTSEEIMAVFEALNAAGLTLIIVTHEPDIAARAKRKLVFRDGQIIEDMRLRP